MRNFYPKLITTLFLILFAAMVLKYAESGGSSADSNARTAQMNKGSQ